MIKIDREELESFKEWARLNGWYKYYETKNLLSYVTPTGTDVTIALKPQF